MQKMLSKPKIGLLVSLCLILAFSFVFVYAKTLVAPGEMTTLGNFFNRLGNLFLWFAIPLVSIAIIAGGVVFLTSFGIPERIALGKRIMLYSGIGLGVVLIGVGLGQWLGEKEEAYKPFTPLSQGELARADNYLTFLEDEIVNLKALAKEAETEGKTELSKHFNQRAEELSNIVKPLNKVIEGGLLETSEKEAVDNCQKYEQLSAAKKAGESVDESELKTAFQDCKASQQKAEMYQQYIFNTAEAMKTYGQPETAKPGAITPPPQWDGQTPLSPGDIVRINGKEVIWYGHYWWVTDSKAMNYNRNNKVRVEFAKGEANDFHWDSDDFAWKDKNESFVNFSAHRLLETVTYDTNYPAPDIAGAFGDEPADLSNIFNVFGERWKSILKHPRLSILVDYYYLTPQMDYYDWTKRDFKNLFEAHRGVYGDILTETLYYNPGEVSPSLNLKGSENSNFALNILLLDSLTAWAQAPTPTPTPTSTSQPTGGQTGQQLGGEATPTPSSAEATEGEPTPSGEGEGLFEITPTPQPTEEGQRSGLELLLGGLGNLLSGIPWYIWLLLIIIIIILFLLSRRRRKRNNK